jgi:hypothetical protein
VGWNNYISRQSKKAKQFLKTAGTSGNYGCCSTRAPLVEKYKIVFSDTRISLYLWSTLAVESDVKTKKSTVNKEYSASNYEKKIIDWFIQKSTL